MVHTTNSGKSGRLYNRIRYLRKTHNMKSNETDEVASASPLPIQEDVQNEQYSMNDLLFLKTVVISETNYAQVLKGLETTRKQRDELVRKETIDLIEQFPFSLFIRNW